jgi:hypothetical protein
MSETLKPDRIFIAFLEEWNERHPEGSVIDPELQELISRHLNYARTISAEAVINKLIVMIELTPRPNSSIPITWLLEVIRLIDPNDIDQLITPFKREFKLKKNMKEFQEL